MNTYVEVAVSFQSFLTSSLYEGECLTSCHGRFYPRKKNTFYPLRRRAGGPQNQSGRREKKILLPFWAFEPVTSSRQPSCYTDCATAANVYVCVCVCVCVCMYECMYVCVCVCVCMYV